MTKGRGPKVVCLFDVRTELSLAASGLLVRAVTGGGGCCWARDGVSKEGVARAQESCSRES